MSRHDVLPVCTWATDTAFLVSCSPNMVRYLQRRNEPNIKTKKKALVVRLGGFGVKKLSSPETLSPLWNTSYSVLPSLYWYAVRLLLSSINADFLAPSWGHEAESLRINTSLINTVYALLKSIFTLMPTVWHLRSKGDRRGLGRVLR